MHKKTKSDKNWMATAVKKPGALRKELGTKKGKKIPMALLDKKAAALKKKAKGSKKLTKSELLESRRITLAKTFKRINAKKGKK